MPADSVITFLDAYNAGDWDRVRALVTPGYAHHNNAAVLTIDDFLGGARWLRDAMPDFRIDVQDMFGESDRVAVRFIGRGTHSSSLMGEPATGAAIALHGIMIYRCENDLIAEDWEAMDAHDLLRQIGAIPT